jgi:hypothetical protein
MFMEVSKSSAGHQKYKNPEIKGDVAVLVRGSSSGQEKVRASTCQSTNRHKYFVAVSVTDVTTWGGDICLSLLCAASFILI